MGQITHETVKCIEDGWSVGEQHRKAERYPLTHWEEVQLARAWRLSQWVPVEERMPEPGTDCLVWLRGFGKGPFAAIDRWDEQREAPVSFSSQTVPIGLGWGDHEFDEVTHWMPLPAAPIPCAYTPAFCGRCDRSPEQATRCPHGERCGRKDVSGVKGPEHG